tara:strand:+ start:189 stop:626 length:438 start_codon:yes stop_codon:yes gene_type:complete
MGASAASNAALGAVGVGGNQSAQQLALAQLANQGISSLASSLINQGPQIGTAQQIAASGINNQDPNNLSSSGWGGVVTEANNMMNPSVAQEATGNAPDNTITAGMAVGNAPVATAGNFNPQTQFAANKMFGNGTQFAKPKKLINL